MFRPSNTLGVLPPRIVSGSHASLSLLPSAGHARRLPSRQSIVAAMLVITMQTTSVASCEARASGGLRPSKKVSMVVCVVLEDTSAICLV